MEEVTERNIFVNGNDNQESDGNTSFLRAARNGQLEKVLEHLKTNIDINTSNANGLNALHLASKDGHVEIVEELLKRGAIVDAATKKGNTALHIASLAGQEEVVKLLVHHGASVNVQSQNGFTPLYMAAQENHDNVVKFLLANGANQSLSTEDGFTPLAVAMQQGHDKVVTVLLENDTRGKVRLPALHIAAKKDDVRAAKLLLENDHNPDVTSKSGFTPLHIASHYGNQSIANLLIQKGADVNYSAKHNITPLHVAAKWGKNNMVAVLLEQGAHIEAKTRDGLTPLHCAARSGHEQVVDMLLEKSAPISSKTKNGLAPLHMAAQGDHVDAARILLYHRAPVDEVTVDYLTALHVAAHCGHVRVAKLLLDRQADANARALNGFTPLHIACKKNRIKVVELLLKHGACIGATTESGLTPLHVASFMGCMNIVIYLLQHDASPDIPTVRGETPLHLAARANQTDIIRILLRNGAQVDARAREQQTPLHIASRLGNVDIVMLLLQHGAKVDNSTKDMYTALHIAAKEGQDEVAAVLIENGASLNATTKKGFTPLHLAAKYGHLKVAKLLLQKEAPVDAQGKNGVTPLHVASHYDHQNVALLLLDKGASPHANAKNGHTPLHIAARKNQMDIAHTLLEYGAQPDAESKAGFTPLHLSSQEGHTEISALLLENKAAPSHQSKNGLTPMHLCAQENKVGVAQVLHNNGAEIDSSTKGGYTPLHIASHYGQADMVKFLLSKGANVKATTSIGYTPLHQAAQQGHTNIVNILLENSAQPNAVTNSGQTPLHIAQKLGYITVIDTLKEVTESTQAPASSEEKYRVVAPEAMQETFLSDSEEEGEDTLLGDQTYRYLTADEMKSLGDDSLPIDVTRDERIDSNRMVGSDDVNAFPPRHIEDSISPEHIHPNYVEYIKKTTDNIDISKHPLNIGFLVSFLVDARGGAMRGCRHSGVRVIVPPRCAHSPTRITCRYVRPQRTPHPPPLMEGEALASRVLELGPVGATFLGPVIIEVPHFAALRGKEREIVVLRSDNGESWKEHTVEATEDVLNEILRDSFEADDLNQLEDVSSGRITRIVTQDFPQYFAVISRIRQEVHAIGPEGGMVSSTVVPQVQAVFPQGALTKKIKVGLQAQPIDPELTAKMLGHGVAVSPVVTVEPRRRKFHKAITLSMPAPRAHSQGMINQYSGSAPTLRLLCSITGGTSRAQWEDVTGSTPLTFVNDCVSFTTTVSARFWLMDCRNIGDATKMATELYREAIHVPFIAKFMVFAKRIDPLEARLRVFCMTDDKEDKTLEYQEQFTEIAKSRDVEVLEGKSQYVEFVGNLVPVTKSGEQLQFSFRAFKENRLPFSVRVKDQHAEAVSRCLFMREPKVHKGEPPQQPICILNILLPDDIVSDTISLTDSDSIRRRYFSIEHFDYYRQDPRLADISNLLGDDWVQLANQLGLTTSEINVIKSEYPDSVAKQAQSMLRMWLSQSGNRTQANTLDNALRRIGRDDIVIQCLNEDNRSKQILRIKPEEKEKYRLNDEISDHDFSSREDYYSENDKGFKTKSDTFDKYSAEEKSIEPSDEEEDFNKTVPEIREQIVKRLSNERTIPASSQRVEIVQEISSIKRKSLVEDKIAEVQQKANTEPIKIITVKPMTKISLEKKTLSEVTEAKTTTPEYNSERISESPEIEEKSRTNVSNLESQVDSERRDSILLEEVTHRLEYKKPVSNLKADEDPKSPKFSKTPPPSPADFIMREKEATTAQEWCATKTDLIDVSSIQYKGPNQDAQGQASSPQCLDKLEGKLLDKNVDTYVVKFPNTEMAEIYDFEQTSNKTNAFLKFESKGEPYDIWTDVWYKDLKSEMESPRDTTLEKKKVKKGIFKTLKTLITKSTENLVPESEKLSPKKEKNDRTIKTISDVSIESSEITKPAELFHKGEYEKNNELFGAIHCEKPKRNVNDIKTNIGASTYQSAETKHDKTIVHTTAEFEEENVLSQLPEKQYIKTNILEEITDNSKTFRQETEIDLVHDPFETKYEISSYADEMQKTDIGNDKIDENKEKNLQKSTDTSTSSSHYKNGTENSAIIRKEKKLVSEEESDQMPRKPGIWSFLTKKSKKTTVGENETNILPEKSSEKHFDEHNFTRLFLQQEKNNYDDNCSHTDNKSHENISTVLNENLLQKKSAEKSGICESLLSKLKLSDSSSMNMESSYIKFDEDDLPYNPIAIVSQEKPKRVTFEEITHTEKLPTEDVQLPQAERLICRIKDMNTDAQISSTQDLIEGDNDRKRSTGELENHDLHENSRTLTINDIMTHTDNFLKTETSLYTSEQTTVTAQNIQDKKSSITEIPDHLNMSKKLKCHLPLGEGETSIDKSLKSRDINEPKMNADINAAPKESELLISKNDDTESEIDTNKTIFLDQDLIILSDTFLKKEIIHYNDVKFIKVEDSTLNDKISEKSKKKKIFSMFSKKKQLSDENINSKKTEEENDHSIMLNIRTQDELKKEVEIQRCDPPSKESGLEINKGTNALTYSSDNRDEVFKTLPEQNKHFIEEKDTIANYRIPDSSTEIKTGEEYNSNGISSTTVFLNTKKNLYDGMNYSKRTSSPREPEVKGFDDEIQSRQSNEAYSLHDKCILEDSSSEVNNELKLQSYTPEISTLYLANNIQSTNNFLQAEKNSYDSEIHKDPRCIGDNSISREGMENTKKMLETLNFSRDSSDHRSAELIDISDESIEKEEASIEKTILKQNSESEMSNIAFNKNMCSSKKLQNSSKELIQSTFDFLSMEVMTYNDVEKELIEEMSQENIHKENGTNIEINQQTYQENKVTEKKSKRFLKIFGKKSKSKSDKTDDKEIASDVTGKFLTTETSLYDNVIRDRPNKKKPEIVESLTNESTAAPLENQVFKTQDKSMKPKGIFKIFNKKSEEKDNVIVDSQAEITKKIQVPEDKTDIILEKKYQNIQKTESQSSENKDISYIKCKDIYKATDVFLNTEKNVYYDSGRNVSKTSINESVGNNYVLETSEDFSEKKRHPEKTAKTKKFLKIFQRRSEEKDLLSDSKVREEKSVEDGVQEDKHRENRDRFNIFGKKSKPVEKQQAHYKIEKQKGENIGNSREIINTTNDFLHKEKNNYYDVRHTESKQKLNEHELHERESSADKVEPINEISCKVNSFKNHVTLKNSDSKFEQSEDNADVLNKHIIFPTDANTEENNSYKISAIRGEHTSTEFNIESAEIKYSAIEKEMKDKKFCLGDGIINENAPQPNFQNNTQYSTCVTDIQDISNPVISREDEQIQVLKQDKSVENEKLGASSDTKKNDEKCKQLPTDFLDKEEKAKGIMRLFVRKNRSKERKEQFTKVEQPRDEKLSPNNLQACKLFLEKEVELYHEPYFAVQSKNITSMHSRIPDAQKSDMSNILQSSEKSSKQPYFLSAKEKSHSKLELTVNEKGECSHNIFESAAPKQEAFSIFEDTFQSRKNQQDQNIQEIQTVEVTSKTNENVQDIEECKHLPTDFVDKEEKAKGIMRLFVRKNRSKERKEQSTKIEQPKDEELLPYNLQACKLFLVKEVELYHEPYFAVQSKNITSMNSRISDTQKSDMSNILQASEESSKQPYFSSAKEKSQSKLELTVNETDECSDNISESAAPKQEAFSNFVDTFQSRKNQQVQNIQEIKTVKVTSKKNENMEDIEEYTAFDFIEEEVKHFENSRLRFTDTIDSSFRVETKVEQIGGDDPKETITKKIIISEKLVEKPGPANSSSETSNAILEKLINETFIDKVKPQAIGQHYSESASKDTSDENYIVEKMVSTVSQIADKIPLQKKSRSQEKLECIEVEYVHKMKDLELAKGDVIEDMSPLEKKIEIISNDSEEKITDLDECLPHDLIDKQTVPLITKNETKPLISCITVEASEEPIRITRNGIDAEGSECLDAYLNNTTCEKKIAVTKLSDKESQLQDVPETVQVTENFMKELEIKFYPDKCILSKDRDIAIFSSKGTKEEVVDETLQSTSQNEFNNLSFNQDDNLCEDLVLVPSNERSPPNIISSFGLTDSIHPPSISYSCIQQEIKQNTNEADTIGDAAQIETGIHDVSEFGSTDSSTRKPLFRIESEEDDLIISFTSKELDNQEHNISEVMMDHSPILVQDETKLISENILVIDSKSDVEIIEDKLRDLGKALDALEKLSEIKSNDKNEQLSEKKLRRVEKKFERMASETLESTNNYEQEVKTYDTAVIDPYQQLVSHLSTDEVTSSQIDYSNLWDDYTFSKSDEWDSKTPESQADVLEIPQGDVPAQSSGTTEISTIRERTPDSATENQEGQVRPQTYDQHQLSEEMKELLEEMEKTNKM